MRITLVEVADGYLGFYADDQFVTETQDGIVIEIAEKLRDLKLLDAYHYVHRPELELEEFPPLLIDVFMRDVEN